MIRQQGLAAKAESSVTRLWSSVSDVSDATQARFAREAARAMGAIREASAGGTVAYLSTYESLVTGEAVHPDVDVNQVATELRGVPVDEVYARPFITSRISLGESADMASALNAGLARLRSIASTDVTLSQNVAAVEHMQMRSRVTGYRRIPNGGACILCQLASTQRYTTGTLMPIHDHCHCGIGEIIGSVDPGHVRDKDLLKAITQEFGKTTNPNPESHYKKFVKVTEHGELGSVLSRKA